MHIGAMFKSDFSQKCFNWKVVQRRITKDREFFERLEAVGYRKNKKVLTVPVLEILVQEYGLGDSVRLQPSPIKKRS